MNPSAKELRPKSGKTMVACAAAGGKQVLLKRWECAGEAKGKTFAYLVLPDLQGKGPVRQRSILADLTFWSLLGQAKSD